MFFACVIVADVAVVLAVVLSVVVVDTAQCAEVCCQYHHVGFTSLAFANFLGISSSNV